MKIKITFLSALMLISISSNVYAEEPQGFNPSELIQATSISMDMFKTSNPDHLVHLSGFKTWKSGVDSKVKFYVAHDGMNMEFNFLCTKQDSQIRCSSI